MLKPVTVVNPGGPPIPRALPAGIKASIQDFLPLLLWIGGAAVAVKFVQNNLLKGLQPAPVVMDYQNTPGAATPSAVQVAQAQQIATVQAIQARNSSIASAFSAAGSAGQANADLQAAQAQYAAAMDQLNQAQSLYAQGLINSQQLQQYEQQVTNVAGAVARALNGQYMTTNQLLGKPTNYGLTGTDQVLAGL